MAAYSPGQRIVLLNLPDEILLNVVDKVEEDGHDGFINVDVWNLRHTCRHLSHLCAPAQSRHIVLRINSDYHNPFFATSLHQNKHVEVLEILPSNDDVEGALASLKHFPKIKTLEISNRINDTEWEDVLNSEIRRATFRELQECVLRFWEQARVPLSTFLRAPKLKSLKLDNACVQGMRTQSVVAHSSVLKELCLYNCILKKSSTAHLLSAPLALEKFELTSKPSLTGVSTPPDQERREIKWVIEILRAQQPGLISLDLTSRRAFTSTNIPNNLLDLERFEALERLSLNVHADSPARDQPWSPVKFLRKLPTSLRMIELSSGSSEFDLEKLALGLISAQWQGRSLPGSLQTIKISTVKNLSDEDFFLVNPGMEEATLLRGIRLLMTKFSVMHLDYTYRDYNTNKMRHISAKAVHDADYVEKPGSSSTLYVLGDQIYPPPPPRQNNVDEAIDADDSEFDYYSD